ncbi:hypothetical protein LHJ74_06760 [Streptomyces sp. N2-109]|uniref:Integral membrane protein n=1 Tax=Streptomyces gossypii TaxID=2883101 RepID=A0ABT2JP17_9ACTN|nr:hypothetical protein [Streptomyces gossypii]MCT2589627.1 hypothetical protein [Streptomyces gossypii]
MDTVTSRGTGSRLGFGVALAAAALVTAGWGLVGLGTENFGSDCLYHFGETGPRAQHCHEVNDRAETWFPRLVSLAWICSVLSVFRSRRLPAGQHVAAGIAVACLAVAVVLGVHAMTVTTP